MSGRFQLHEQRVQKSVSGFDVLRQRNKTMFDLFKRLSMVYSKRRQVYQVSESIGTRFGE